MNGQLQHQLRRYSSQIGVNGSSNATYGGDATGANVGGSGNRTYLGNNSAMNVWGSGDTGGVATTRMSR